MTLRHLSIFAVLVLAVIAGYFLLFQDNDIKQIKKNFDAILENVEKLPNEGNISMVAKHQALSRLIDDQLSIECFNPALKMEGSSDTLLSSYLSARHYAKSISLSYDNLEIAIQSPDYAQLSCYGHAKIHSVSGETYDESRQVILLFHKKDSKWLLAKAREYTVFQQ